MILALVAGGGAFFLLTQAQQQAATTVVPQVAVVVATRTIPGRKAIEAADVTVKNVPADAVGSGAYTDPAQVLNRVPAVTILEGQQVTSNLLASNQVGGQFSILG
ncbi:MAG TPA: SAF domain-containing protein, partial [Cellulomonadaceae bacterium]|nr:SAF domain-containing protein [Cellulomonadaceae bacterium]